MHWILQNDERPDAGTMELYRILGKLELPHSYHKVFPSFNYARFEIDPVPKVEDGRAICMGSYAMLHVAREHGWSPGVFDIGHLTYADHVVHWKQWMLNSDAVYTTFREVPDHLPFGKDEEYFFLRPTVDSKFFDGKDYTVGEFMLWWHRVVVKHENRGNGLRPDTQVLLARAKPIGMEFRVWIVDGEPVTASRYRISGRLSPSHLIDMDIMPFARARAREWAPHEAYVMDIGRTSNGLHIIETNTLNAAGLYSANVGLLVEALESKYG